MTDCSPILFPIKNEISFLSELAVTIAKKDLTI